MRKNKQTGFALLDMLIAVLVLGVGVIGVAKLLNVSIQRSQQANYRTEAMASATQAIELFRANRYFAVEYAGTKATLSEASVPYTPQCLNTTSPWCSSKSNKIKSDLTNMLVSDFSEMFGNVPKKAVLCYNIEGGNASAVVTQMLKVRITVVWKTRAGGFLAAKAADCPDSYTASVPAVEQKATGPDRGFIDIYTTI